MDISGDEKNNIRKFMTEKNIGISLLCKKTNISYLKLLYLVYAPFSKLKLTHGIKISNALGINISQLF